MQKTISALLVLVATASAAQALEITGGEVQLGYSAFTEDSDFAKTTLQGSVELGFSRQFGLQLDLGFHDFNLADETTTAATIHGLYHVSDETSLGLFIGQDSLDGETISTYGFEAGQEAANFDVEAFVAIGEEAGISGTLLGLSGRYAVSERFGLGASLQRADFDGGVDITRFGVKADLALGQTASAFVEVGSLSGGVGGVSASETFVGVGAKISFGADRGVTFGKRGLSELIPGL